MGNGRVSIYGTSSADSLWRNLRWMASQHYDTVAHQFDYRYHLEDSPRFHGYGETMPDVTLCVNDTDYHVNRWAIRYICMATSFGSWALALEISLMHRCSTYPRVCSISITQCIAIRQIFLHPDGLRSDSSPIIPEFGLCIATCNGT